MKITDKTHIVHRNPLRYRSYYYDSETGFYHLQTRYYVPEFCRFLNADGIYDTATGILSHNMFAYCNNNPSNAVDEEGTFALTFSVASICVYYAIMGVAVIGAVGAIWSQPKTQQAVSRIAETVTATAKKTVGRVRDKTTQKQKNRDNEPRKHHIVAKAAWRAAESRKILEDVNIKPYTDSKNLITISHGLHKSMHTKRYYAYVNEKLRPCAGNREAVEAALLELRADIAYADATGIKRWEVL